MDLRLEMQTLKNNDLNVEAYTLRLKSIVDNLVAIGEEVTARYLILYGLGGVDSNYNLFISFMSLLMRSDKVQFMIFKVNLCLMIEDS